MALIDAMHLTNKVRHCVLRHYLWIATILFMLSLVSVLTFAASSEVAVKLTIFGLPFTFIYFVQKQKLEEVRVFKDLFQEFNARYDRLNEDLNRIRTDHAFTDLPLQDRDILYNYFNLCGEEYLYYQLGFIPEEVWRSWQRGMTLFIRSPRIWREWNQDPGGDSYYGLTFPQPPLPLVCPVGGSTDAPDKKAA